MKNLVDWVFIEEVSILKTLWFEESKFDSCAVQIASFDKIKTFEDMRETRKCNHLNKSFPLVLLITLYKMVLIYESVKEIWKCDHSKESYWAVLSCGTVYYVVQGVSSLWACGRIACENRAVFAGYSTNPEVWPFKWNLLSSTFLWYCLLRCTR